MELKMADAPFIITDGMSLFFEMSINTFKPESGKLYAEETREE
jgi:hypothetical protein